MDNWTTVEKKGSKKSEPVVGGKYTVVLSADFVRDHVAANEGEAKAKSIARANLDGRATTNTVIAGSSASVAALIGQQLRANLSNNGKQDILQVDGAIYWQIKMATSGQTNLVTNLDKVDGGSVHVKGYIDASKDEFFVTGIA